MENILAMMVFGVTSWLVVSTIVRRWKKGQAAAKWSVEKIDTQGDSDVLQAQMQDQKDWERWRAHRRVGPRHLRSVK